MGGSKNIHAAPVKGGVATEEELGNLLDIAGRDEELVVQAAGIVKKQGDEHRPPLTTEKSNARVEGRG